MKSELEVEKVVKRRAVGFGSVEYYIKWKGLPASSNSWKAKSDLSIKDHKHIDSYEMEFNQMQKESTSCSMHPPPLNQSNQAQEGFRKPIDPIPQAKQIEQEGDKHPMKGEPEKLIRIKTIENKIFFVVKWKKSNDNAFLNDSMVSYQLMREKYPFLVLDFLENRFRLGNNAISLNNNSSEYSITKNVTK